MELRIDSETFVSDIQKQFNALYPYLQLQFFKSGGRDQKNLKREKAQAELLIKMLHPITQPIQLSIANKVTVAQLQKSFRELGFQVQVYRKSGNLWVETSLTDDWTLERQNNEAMLISGPHDQSLHSRRTAP